MSKSPVYMRYSSGRILWMLGGVKKQKSRIASVEEWHQRINWLHTIAEEGCPFAANTMYETERLLDVLGNTLETADVEVGKALTGGFIESEMVRDKRIEITTYAPIACVFVGLFGKYDMLLHKYHLAIRNGVRGYEDLKKMNQVTEKKFRDIKNRPYQYKDYAIRDEGDIGSLEWSKSVGRLGHEPKIVKYAPRYYYTSDDSSREERKLKVIETVG